MTPPQAEASAVVRMGPKPAGAASPFVEAGLLASWEFADGQGQILSEPHGYGMTLGSTGGADTNDPQWVPEGLLFGGDDYAERPYTPELAPPQVTCEVVFRVDSLTGDRVPASFLDGDFQGGFFFASRSGNLQVWCCTSAGVRTAIGLGVATPGSWERLAFSHDGITTRLYRDGVLAFEAAQGYAPAQHGALGFGRWNGTAYFAGAVAYCRLYDRALTQAEIDQNGAALRQVMADRGVQVAW